GADTSIQRALMDMGASHVVVYCSGRVPRNNVANWPVHSVITGAEKGSRAYFTAKDLEMAEVADYGLMMWDSKSTGTLSNVIELLRRGKKTFVFVNKNKNFFTVSNIEGLKNLVGVMSEGARAQAESKIGLASKIASIAQFRLPL